MLEWTHELSVGVDRLDDQHKRWLEIINDLERALSAGPNSSARSSAALGQMIDYTRVHFVAEEELMVQTGYSDYENHKALHAGFVEQLVEITSALKEGDAASAKLLVGVARKWFVGHILVIDKQYAEHFEEHGVS
jgi:hemerythrin